MLVVSCWLLLAGGRPPGTPSGRPDRSFGRPDPASGRPDLSSGGPDLASGAPDFAFGTPDLAPGTPDLPSGTPDPASGTPDRPPGNPVARATRPWACTHASPQAKRQERQRSSLRNTKQRASPRSRKRRAPGLRRGERPLEWMGAAAGAALLHSHRARAGFAASMMTTSAAAKRLRPRPLRGYPRVEAPGRYPAHGAR